MIKKTSEALLESKKTIALTGAGISVESGIPPFRGKGGLWERYDPYEYGHVESFLRDPDKAWIMLKELLDTVVRATPNPAHLALAELEGKGLLEGIITQNVDSLHQAAGTRKVIELHGNNRRLICMKCKKSYPIEHYLEGVPPKCECDFALRPNVVLFGEQLPQEAVSESLRLSKECDLMLVIGTSAMVSPASYIPVTAKEGGAKIIEINPEETVLSSYCDWTIKGKAGEILPKIVEEIRGSGPDHDHL